MSRRPPDPSTTSGPAPVYRDGSPSFVDRLTDAVSLGVAYSILLHAVLLAMASLVVFNTLARPKGLVITAAETEETVASFDTAVEFDAEEGGESSAVEAELAALRPEVFEPQAVPALLASNVTPVPDPTAQTDGKGQATGDGQGNARGSGQGRRLRAPSNAVSEGRFTAWTIPIPKRRGDTPQPGDAPREGQDYHIVLEIQLPKTVRRYSASDLQGVVIGTDGYRLKLPFRTWYYVDGQLRPVRPGGRLPIVDHRVQILVHVPGAERLVRDRIMLGSRVLAETQRLELVFGT